MSLNNFLDRYRGNDFLRSVTVLAGGTAAAQLLMVLLLPVLTRLYSPQDFNTLSVYLGLLSIFSVVATLRFELAISLPEEDGEAAHLLALGLGFSFLTALLVGFGLLLGSDFFTAWLGLPKLAACFWVLPIGVFYRALTVPCNSGWVVEKDFPRSLKLRFSKHCQQVRYSCSTVVYSQVHWV